MLHVLGVERSEDDLAVAHFPLLFRDAFEFPVRADQRIRDVRLAMTPADGSVIFDTTDVGPALRLRSEQLAWIAPLRWFVRMRRRPLSESLVRTLFVVLAAPRIELSLLRSSVLRRGGNDLFECEVSSFQSAVLLRLTRLDPFEAD